MTVQGVLFIKKTKLCPCFIFAAANLPWQYAKNGRLYGCCQYQCVLFTHLSKKKSMNLLKFQNLFYIAAVIKVIHFVN
jgi:hypothetical protein